MLVADLGGHTDPRSSFAPIRELLALNSRSLTRWTPDSLLRSERTLKTELRNTRRGHAAFDVDKAFLNSTWAEPPTRYQITDHPRVLVM